MIKTKMTAMFEIVLLISFSFAVAFVLESGLVSADELDFTSFGDGAEVAPSNSNIPTKYTPDDIFRDLKGKGIKSNSGALTPDQSAALKEGREIEAARNAAGKSGPFKGCLFGLEFTCSEGSFLGPLLDSFTWGIVAGGLVYAVASFAGADPDVAQAYAIAAGAGVFAGRGAFHYFQVQQAGGLVSWPGLGAIGFGGAVAFVVLYAIYKEESKQLVTFECLPFEAPVGGGKCEECNKDPFRPCSEYRCRSLGQACQILDAGSTEERCAWVNPKDVTSPTISPWIEALRPLGLKYIPDNTIRPPNRGVKIISQSNDGCIQAFTPLEFGVNLNEPSRCRIDYNLTSTFDEMQFSMGGSNYHRYNHSQRMKLPGPDSFEGELAPELENDGSFSLFVRCMDPNGNENVDAFVFNFCVDKSPDTTPPRIEGTSIVDGGFVRFGAEKTEIEVYTNEPSECRWSRQSKDYNNMENEMSCDSSIVEINANLNYACKGDLTGIKDREENKFFFRCKDQPGKPESERNVMTQSYPLTLRGTQPLNILRAGPNETIFGSTDTVPVELFVRTDDGAEEGKAICYFSDSGVSDSYVAMFETDNFEHKQELDLVGGNYEYFFRCIDAGGNTAEEKIVFNVFIDREAPLVTRAYKDEGLKIVTNENAECAYSLTSCNFVFDEGLPLIYSNPSIRNSHFAEWEGDRVYYIKCRDLRGNEPGPNECSIVVNSVELGG
jgi:hypothetical protein